jgi:hypothetical protein
MTEGAEITPFEPQQPIVSDKKSWLDPIKGLVSSIRGKNNDRDRVISENEAALQRMSDIAEKVSDWLDSPEFRKNEDTTLRTIDGDSYLEGFSVIDTSESSFTIITYRDPNTGKANVIHVQTTDSNFQITGRDDGSFYFHFSENRFPENRGKKAKYTWSNTGMSGDVYLGKDGSETINTVSIDDMTTRVALQGVNFGNFPTISVTLNASAKGKDETYLGPIAEVNELLVYGFSRSAHPTEGSSIVDGESRKITIGDHLDSTEIPFNFDLGDIGLRIEQINDPTVGQALAFTFSGTRQKFSGDRNHPIDIGTETRTMVVPKSLTDGNKIIDLYEKAVDEVISAWKQRPKLEAKNPVAEAPQDKQAKDPNPRQLFGEEYSQHSEINPEITYELEDKEKRLKMSYHGRTKKPPEMIIVDLPEVQRGPYGVLYDLDSFVITNEQNGVRVNLVDHTPEGWTQKVVALASIENAPPEIVTRFIKTLSIDTSINELVMNSYLCPQDQVETTIDILVWNTLIANFLEQVGSPASEGAIELMGEKVLDKRSVILDIFNNNPGQDINEKSLWTFS